MQSGRPRPTARHTRPGPEIKSIGQNWSDRKSNKTNECVFANWTSDGWKILQRSRVLRIVQWVLVRLSRLHDRISYQVKKEQLLYVPRQDYHPYNCRGLGRKGRGRGREGQGKSLTGQSCPESWDASTASLAYKNFSRRLPLDAVLTGL